MIKIRHCADRGQADLGWLKARYSFSFASYHDSEYMGFRDLRVINEDRIGPSGGFPMHSHNDMEIITYIIDGELQHKDNMGNGSIITRGDIQRMTAGSGITHSEFNPSSENTTHLLQIWIETEKPNLPPGYEDKNYAKAMRNNQLNLIVSKGGEERVAHINQEVKIYNAVLDADREIAYSLDQNRHAWIQMIKGQISVNNVYMLEGDGAAISEEKSLIISSVKDAEFLLFDLR